VTPTLGVCYYPEHWPEDDWEDDARRMAAAGLTWVRIGEFAWSRMEPRPGEFDFDWLDRAVDVLGSHRLKIVMGTPTATPPRWMLDKHPDMLPIGADGQQRGFGSRRHYCFAHLGYRAEAARIARILGERYGQNRHVQAWQIDNEYGCHDTTLSYSDAAQSGFRDWLSQKYQSPQAMNRAWGNVFWSMEYADFDEVELPVQTVTEANPAHLMAYRRFMSDQVVAFNAAQADVLRGLTDAPLIHNYMGRTLEFDHFDVGRDLDIASWDSYPLGFLEDRAPVSDSDKLTFLRQGDPDFQAFHHDLYRAVGRGRWWVMEQQPGPVNWARYNPAPLPGMVRLWSVEAVAHGAEAVCYFRWRQAPFAQEQMHSALLRPDREDAPAMGEALAVGREIAALGEVETGQSPVAIVFDYPSEWAWDAQPQGPDFTYFGLVFDAYRALRRLGLSVDFVEAKHGSLSGYKLILAPGVFNFAPETLVRLSQAASGGAQVFVGPRANSKTEEFSIPTPLPPNLPGLDITVARIESLPADAPVPVEGGGTVLHWFEHLEGAADATLSTEDGMPVLVSDGALSYLGGWPDAALWSRVLARACEAASLPTVALPDGLRIRDTKTHRFAFNYGTEPATFDGVTIGPAGVETWQR